MTTSTSNEVTEENLGKKQQKENKYQEWRKNYETIQQLQNIFTYMSKSSKKI